MKKRTKARRAHAVAAVAVAALVLVVAAGCDSRVDVRGPRFTIPTVPGSPTVPSGPTVTSTLAIPGASGVSLQAVGVVDIKLDGSEQLTVTAPESIMPRLTQRVASGRLILDWESDSYQGQASDIRYDVGLRHLDELIRDGVGEIRAEGVNTDLFRVQMRGIGDIRVAGRADRQEIHMGGLGDYLAPSFETRVASISMASGDAVIWATERIEGWVAMGCTLEYHGNPTVDVTGGGTVRKIAI